MECQNVVGRNCRLGTKTNPFIANICNFQGDALLILICRIRRRNKRNTATKPMIPHHLGIRHPELLRGRVRPKRLLQQNIGAANELIVVSDRQNGRSLKPASSADLAQEVLTGIVLEIDDYQVHTSAFEQTPGIGCAWANIS
jgi:hypothetical protein